MQKIVLAALGGLAVAGASSVHAADMPVKAAPMVTPAPAVWTGCYLGGNIGYGWADKSFSFTPAPDTNTDTLNFNTVFEGTPDQGSHTASGIVGGGQVGCDYHFTPSWVIGFQGMFDGADLTGSHTVPQPVESVTLQPTIPISAAFSTKVRWFGTVTGRLGFLVSPAFLMYAKGGVAFVGDNHTFTVSSPLHESASTGDITRTGWDLGIGWEWLLASNWSVWFEYDHMDFGTRDENFVFSDGLLVEHIGQTLDKVLVGVNYRFGWGKAPVAARY